MPSQDDRSGKRSGFLPMPGTRLAEPVSGPLPAGGKPATRTLPETASPQPQRPASAQPVLIPPATTGQLPDPRATRAATATLPQVADNPTQRGPVVIKPSMKRPVPPPPLLHAEQEKRRTRVAVLGLVMLVLVGLLAFFTVTPLGHDIRLGNPLALPGGSLLIGQRPGASSLVVQATATAVFHRKTDGYDPTFYGSQLLGNGISSLVWPLGQCTYWSNYEYHRLTGYWVSWNGNANQWVSGARQAGWHVSQTPHVPSILVMMPYTQGASGYGHVAVVEGVSGNTVHTSNMNWYTNGGGWGRVSNVDFTTGNGIYFIWHS